MALLLKGACLKDPAADLDGVSDVRISDGRIAEVEDGIEPAADDMVLDLAGKVMVPGLVDLHVHLREPGYEYKETIYSGCRAAAHGGFTDVAPMPNTNPVCDDGSRVEYLLARARECGCVHVRPVGAISKGLDGSALSSMGDMAAHGVFAFSDDGRGVQDDGLMRRAMDYAKQFDLPLLSHCQRESLSGSGVVNEGVVSTRLGMAGWPAAAEEIQIARDVRIAELTRCQLHIQHLTTRRGVEIVADAKRRGVPVTCEVTPHHLFLCEDDIDATYDTNLKMNPPLRSAEDRDALQQALIDGLIDVVATDHAPHAAHEKALEFEIAPFGTTGLETALPLMLTNLVSTGRMSWRRLVECMAIAPRKILHLPEVSLTPGSPADLTVIDPDLVFSVDGDWFESAATNCAFTGCRLKGMATETIVDGKPVMISGKVLA